MKSLDMFHMPLQGVNLIEASAGTGKTYTIEGIYLRLVIECGLNPEKILVVTFTKAATEELKDRIRKKLRDTNRALNSGHAGDPFIAELIHRSKDIKTAINRVKTALVDFDTAAIHTIHGFCQRILTENAFETQTLFDMTVAPDVSEIMDSIAMDFWRNRIYSAPAEFAVYAGAILKGPAYFTGLARRRIPRDIILLPDKAEPAYAGSLHSLRNIFFKLKKVWTASKEDVLTLLKSQALNATIYGSMKPVNENADMRHRDKRIALLGKEMDQFFGRPYPALPLIDHFKLFSQSKIISATQKKQTPPCHEFFSLCDAFLGDAAEAQARMDDYLICLQKEFIDYVLKESDIRKAKTGTLSYDDQLLMVHKALLGASGRHLLEKIRKSHAVALVDEFQDTDDIQYDIFHRIFAGHGGLFLMIGDPKQAIYDFRGADIFSYLRAAATAPKAYTLERNYRSAPELISAVNTIFSNRKNPFLFKDIRFENVFPGGISADPPFNLPAGLVVWHLFDKNNDKKTSAMPKQAAMLQTADAIAGEIHRLKTECSGGIGLGDMAVLVRTNRQAALIRDRLANARIPCVIHQTGNVFQTAEALDVERVLMAMAEPGNDRFLKAALCTDLMGYTASELDVHENSHRFESVSLRFKQFASSWRQSGFIRMFRGLLAEEGVKKRLMSYPDGERRLTNLIHLSEILHQIDREKKAGAKGLARWLADQRLSAETGIEEHLVRMDKDAEAVNILTIHKSKGLEFSVVFCPFPWDGVNRREKYVQFHDPSRGRRRVMDLGSADFGRHERIARLEQLAENIRLFYVALTRAKTRCYMAWGKIRGAETAAAAYLFHYRGNSEEEDLISKMEKAVSAASDQALLKDLALLAEKSNHHICVKKLPHTGVMHTETGKGHDGNVSFRKFEHSIHRMFGVASYSSLIAGMDDDAQADRDDVSPYMIMPYENDEFPPSDGNIDKMHNILYFPRGTRAGLLFHDIFENVSFHPHSNDACLMLAETKLKEYGFDSKWKIPVVRMVQQVLGATLHGDGESIVLSNMPSTARIHEMEFYFRLKKTDPDLLARAFGPYVGHPAIGGYMSHLGRLAFSPVKGFMKGYIDMVFMRNRRFYLVDWKSNHLGFSRDNYRNENLNRTMHTHHYMLQYHLYVLALHRYLKMKLPGYDYNRNFGGVFYLFIRGMDQRDSGYGIYFDKPGADLIQSLEDLLIDAGGTGSDMIPHDHYGN